MLDEEAAEAEAAPGARRADGGGLYVRRHPDGGGGMWVYRFILFSSAIASI
jgi:hypothetical protein